MARKAMVQKNNDNKELAKKYVKYRRELREKAINMKLSDDERMTARKKLQALPRDTSMNRVTARCQLTGRPRRTYKKFALSRMTSSALARDGKLPGVTKASW